ncbi:Zinc finger, nanos-type [Cinara cedri]|uniref:Zinc finger, nanos-type n=1 Tax=Cinara cedri TaxID=506608 RepID=A0A5E4N885_9HEMI|nr:Zinc finger, nanos-type [Cinara cedri]
MMILRDDIILNDALYPHKNIYDRATVLLQNLPFRLLSKISKENFEPFNSQKMRVHYSKRFPSMCMSSTFYDDIMNIAEMHVHYYQSRWFDFSQKYSESSSSDYPVPWGNCSVYKPIQTTNTFVQNVDYKYNNNQKKNSNSHTVKIQLSKKLVTTPVPTTSPIELCSSSSSPINVKEPETPIKIVSKSNPDFEKSPEVNNNKISNITENEDIKNRSITLDNSKSNDITDEKAVSYAEIMKYSKPKQYLLIKSNIVKESKKGEPNKSNRIPPSKKISIKFPDGPYLPNNQHCAFCKNNGEDENLYRTHFVKDELGNVKCPLLSRYTCPHCKATGPKAHTISRCPLSNKNRINRFNKQQ